MWPGGSTPICLAFRLLTSAATGRREFPNRMSVELPDWPRSRYQPGGGEAYLLFTIYGEFNPEVEVSRKRYRTAGIPRGLNVRRVEREKYPDFPFSTGPLGGLLQAKQPAL